MKTNILLLVIAGLIQSCGLHEDVTPNTTDFVTFERIGQKVSIHIESNAPEVFLKQDLGTRIEILTVKSHYYDCIRIEQFSDIEIYNKEGYFLIEKL